MKRKQNYIVLFFFLSFLSVSLPSLAFSAETKKPSVAVLWFENRTPDRKLDYLDQLIPDLIAAESSKAGFCNLLEREEIEKALDEVMLSKQGFVSPIEKIKGRIAETTDFILSGYFEKKETNLIVSVRLYNWKKGTSQTMDFTYALFEIKERIGKDIAEYLQKSVKSGEDGNQRLVTVSRSTTGIVIFLDVKDTFFNFDDAAQSDIIYDYPYGVILLEKLKDDFQSKGVSYEIITNKDDWNRILQKNPAPAQPARVYQILRNGGWPTLAIRDLGTTDSPINPRTADLGNIKSKTLSGPSFPFSSLKEDDIFQYISGSVGIETYRGNEIYSPQVESLIYYDNYLRQKGYGDYAAAYQEIMKALYLYPDFSFYWFILQESCRRLEKHEK